MDINKNKFSKYKKYDVKQNKIKINVFPYILLFLLTFSLTFIVCAMIGL